MNEIEIQGDNILECERALRFVATSLTGDGAHVSWLPSPLYAPCYEVTDGTKQLLVAQLLPGYGRWGDNIQEYLRTRGAPLREATDAIILRIKKAASTTSGEPVLAFEFCGALPAGNNAWQRCGRALACAYAGVPYLYFAELGGVELGAGRKIKAARLPNPLVPFAYVTLGQSTGSIVVPVFTPSPSISEVVAKPFVPCMGEDDARALVRALIVEGNPTDAAQRLREKAIRAAQVLASLRRRKDTLEGNEWVELASQPSGSAKASWLLRKRMPWAKKVGIESLTGTFLELVDAATRSGAVAIGSRDMPFCLLAPENRLKFAELVERIYGRKLTRPFAEWLGSSRSPLAMVWVCGFKPRGDDSRPDRGLVPLVRMLLGSEGVEYLSVVYGPATQTTWKHFATDMWGLARINGLWEAIVGLSDAILVDSQTAVSLETVGVLVPKTTTVPVALSRHISTARTTTPLFGEHDVDSVLHALFSNARDMGAFEAMCNPPGGDWSGLSFQASREGTIFRWTSLPRVSGDDTKRPDHVIIFCGPPLTVLSIESKDLPKVVERGIGPRLSRYVRELSRIPPNICCDGPTKTWQPHTMKADLPEATMISAAAFRFTNIEEVGAVLTRGEVDLVLAVQIGGGKELTRLHVMSKPSAAWVGPKLSELAQRFTGRLEVQVY